MFSTRKSGPQTGGLSPSVGGDYVRIKVPLRSVEDILRGMASLQWITRPQKRAKNGLEMLISMKDIANHLTPEHDLTDIIESGGTLLRCFLALKYPVMLIRKRKYGRLRPFTDEYALCPWTPSTPPRRRELLDPDSEEPEVLPSGKRLPIQTTSRDKNKRTKGF